MKVLHVIPSLGPLRGGPSVALPTMAASLARLGVDVDIVTTDDNGPGRLTLPLSTPLFDRGVTTRYFARQTRLYTFCLPLTVWLARHTVDYDLVHIHALFSYPSLPAAWYAGRSRVPYIIRPLGTLNRWGMTQRRPRLKRLSFHMVERRILSNAAAIHYTSEQERHEARRLGVHGKEFVIPLGIETTDFDNLPNPGPLIGRFPALKDRTLILFLSRLDEKKGLDTLLSAFSEVRAHHPEAALVIAGNGSPAFVSGLKEQATALGLDHDVVFTGFLSGADKLSALAASSMFVLPSHSENFGVAVVEAMAAGLPVVVSTEVGIARETHEAGAGLVAAPRADSLAAALQQLVSDRSLRRTMSENARRFVRTRFSANVTAQRLLEAYNEIVVTTGAR